MKALASLVSGEGLLPSSQMAVFLLYSYRKKGNSGILWCLFIRTVSHSWGLHLHNLINSQSSISNVINWGLDFSMWIGGGRGEQIFNG
jgi:hypothetical protein